MIPTSKECRASILAVYKTNENLYSDPYGTVMPMDTLVSLTMQRMNVQPQEWNKVADKVRAHIQNNAKEDGIFIISRGKGGGVKLREGTRL